jgi:hypothetical protein
MVLGRYLIEPEVELPCCRLFVDAIKPQLGFVNVVNLLLVAA